MTTVVFDVGNVLIEWDMKALYRKLLPDDAAIDAFLDETGLMTVNVELDRGLPFAEGLGALAARFPDYASLILAYKDRWSETVVGAIDGSVAVLNELKDAGCPLYAITNFSAETWPLATARFPFLATHFIDTVVSGQERLIKPDPAIYTLLLERNNLPPEDCIFIDDSPKNVEGARAVGMQAIHFTDPESLRAELTQLGVKGVQA